MDVKISVVIVTYNRLECIKKALPLYENQTYAPVSIIVVDNNSNDGTKEYLNSWKKQESNIKKTVVSLDYNAGGAGGFGTGMETAMKEDCDLVWVADDDAYPDPDALFAFNEFANNNPETYDSICAMCGTIMDYDREKILLGHHCRIKKILGIPVMSAVPKEEYAKEYFDIDFVSYVGTAIKKETLERVGVTRKDFFIYSDDWEHSIRIRKEGRMICVPKSTVLHVGESSKVAHTKRAVWHDYYTTRNLLIALKLHYGMGACVLRTVMRMLTALKSFNPEKIKIFVIAIKDAYKGKTGIHPIYKPGFTSEKE